MNQVDFKLKKRSASEHEKNYNDGCVFDFDERAIDVYKKTGFVEYEFVKEIIF